VISTGMTLIAAQGGNADSAGFNLSSFQTFFSPQLNTPNGFWFSVKKIK
jgi:hypothetical protein